MIDLTPLEVRNKKDDFKRGLRGYDPREVDAFLAVVADALERQIRESGASRARVQELEQQLETYRARERALNDALLAAQELREETRLQAERDAAVRLREAEEQVRAVLDDAEQAVRACQDKLDDLTATRGQFLGSLRQLFERFDEYLDFEDARFEAGTDDLDHLVEQLRAEPGDGASGQSPSEAASITRVDAGGSGAAST
ncbi:DivIVA domain-containing protein [Candidatus Palauibacter sp.]|uniref:DivIVA domain-containing protein n=1 Tax=Candidatus Palauibacter sp. TaxID=3101350 RepID=UPI003B023B08